MLFALSQPPLVDNSAAQWCAVWQGLGGGGSSLLPHCSSRTIGEKTLPQTAKEAAIRRRATSTIV